MNWGKTQILSVSLAVALMGTGTYLYLTRKVEKVPEKVPSFLWELAVDKVYQGWRGDLDLSDENVKKNCPHIHQKNDQIPIELKACRKEVFSCFFKNREMSLKSQSEFFPFRVFFTSGFLKDKGESNTVTLKVAEEQRDFEINDFCRQASLPEGAYWGDKAADKNKRIWHTSDISYAVDRFLVRNIDVREWLLQTATDSYSELKQRYFQRLPNLFDASVDLFPDDMKSYCSYRRSEVLSSRVRAAITFHHGRSDESLISTRPPSYNTPPHPFGIRQQDSPQYRLEKSADGERVAKRADCRFIYGKDCLSHQYFDLFPNSMGWSGVSELLGGPAEYVVNKRYPRKNLHPSSYYHPVSSAIHQAGVRVYWSGKGHRRIDFNFFTEPFFETSAVNPEDKFDVGFRCMKKRLVL